MSKHVDAIVVDRRPADMADYVVADFILPALRRYSVITFIASSTP